MLHAQRPLSDRVLFACSTHLDTPLGPSLDTPLAALPACEAFSSFLSNGACSEARSAAPGLLTNALQMRFAPLQRVSGERAIGRRMEPRTETIPDVNAGHGLHTSPNCAATTTGSALCKGWWGRQIFETFPQNLISRPPVKAKLF